MGAGKGSKTAYRAGKTAFETGNYKEAANAFRWAAGLDPENPVYSHAAALSAARAGAVDQAERLFFRALAAIQRTLGESHPFMLIVARDFTVYCRKNNRPELDIAAFVKRIVDSGNVQAIARSGDRTLQALAELCAIAGRPCDAIPFFEEALEYRRNTHGSNHPKTRLCAITLDRIRTNGNAQEGRDKWPGQEEQWHVPANSVYKVA